MNVPPPLFPPLSELAAQLRDGSTTPLALVETCLARIDAREDQLRAWVSVDARGALEAARRMTPRGRCGPLWGLPIGVKDIIDQRGEPTRAGSPLRAAHIADDDAPIVARLRAQGAILLGKTVPTQFACFDPPETRNPWDVERTPGGSSSGSAAAVAAGMCVAALGSQTGGSIIRPAAYCGIAGFKPTVGTIPTDGVVPVSFTLDHVGPMARTAADLEWMWYGMTSGSAPAETPAAPRVLITGDFFRAAADPAVLDVFDRSIVAIRDAGAPVREIRLPASFSVLHRMHRRIMAVEAAEYHRDAFLEHAAQFAPAIRGLIDEGLATPSYAYAAALKHRRQFRRDMQALVAEGDILITPSASSTAPRDLTTTGDPSFHSPWSYSGVPVAGFTCGLADDGMPCGLQLVGHSGCDVHVLRAARWCETVLCRQT